MIKVFTLNKNGKIELTKKELEQLLNESYWEGYVNSNHYYTYCSPSTINNKNWYENVATTPYNVYTTTTTTTANSDSVTVKTNLGD